jgi:hypothetical protein
VPEASDFHKLVRDDCEANRTFLCSFEDRFRYDDEGRPKVWRPTDDVDGKYSRARDETLKLIPLLSRFRLSETSSWPPIDSWIGARPPSTSRADEDDLVPIGGVDDGDSSVKEEMVVLSAGRQAEAEHRFRKMADGVYLEAKRGALGGVTQTPWYIWLAIAVLGKNEFTAVLRNPFLVVLSLILIAGAYMTYQLNLWGPIIRMSTAAWEQGFEVGKERLREFLINSETGRQAVAMEGRGPVGREKNSTVGVGVGEGIRLEKLDSQGKRGAGTWDDDD